ncbi:MAG: tungstate ABC transporter substrate-binding protein WtpA [Bacteroidia bacterium]|nr:tungstate ABC transporter substrate-binding protein WtpA [Bacteroidia bacterium]
MRRVLFLILISGFAFVGCKNKSGSNSGEIIIFNAGSLSVPFKQMKDEYEKRNPGVKILMEPAGSLVCARKITELKKPCDIIASADYFVINKLLIPEYTSWTIRFATNEMVIAFLDKSTFSGEMNSENWYEILSSDKVTYSRADPDSDPGGYRTVLTLMLAEKYYNQKDLAERLLLKNKNYIRPKEVDLIALLESNAVDYIFIYKSVAIQHNLKYVELPDEINLGDPLKNDLYNSVSTEVVGSSPGSRIIVRGEYINYSISVLNNAPHKSEAIEFISFLLSNDGMDILRKNGQEPIIPFSTEQPALIPDKLRQYLETQKTEQNR